ncbi:MAG: FtsX-like permease family protein [Aquabacterium sp.]|nr:FtsX-like permease family protein [Aquabacterium sp.]
MQHWLNRQRYLIDYTLSAMARQRAKNLGLLLVYTALIFVLASVILLGSALRREAAQVFQGAPDVVAQGLLMGRHDLSHFDDVDKLRTLRGAQRVEGRLWGYLYDTSTAANYTLQVPSSHEPTYAVQDGEAIIGEGVARLRKVTVGRQIYLVSPAGPFLNLRVKAILPQASAMVSSDLVLVSGSDFRRFFQLGDDAYTDIAVHVRNPKEIGKIAEKVGIALRQHRVITKGDVLRTYEAVFSWREGMLLALFSAAVLAFGILAFDKASGLSAQERRDIGILKAIGWDTGDIVRMKLWEATLISLTAFLAGFVLAYVHVFFFSAPLLEAVLKGWSVLYPRVLLTPAIDGLQIATLAMLTVLPYLAAIVVPVWRSAAADPDAAMR